MKELIERRRRQLLVHSYLYYRMDDSVVSDDQWDTWARELVQLQQDYPRESAEAPYYEAFKGFDGSTGFHLPLHGESLERISQRILRYKNRNLWYTKNVPNKTKEEHPMAKAKWLVNSSDFELLEIIEKAVEDTKAIKAIDELKLRHPHEEKENNTNPIDAFEQIINLATLGKEAYIEEAEEIAEFEEEEDIEPVDLDGEPTPYIEDDEEEEDVVEDEEEDDEEEIDLDSMTLKELRSMAREEGVYEKGMKKADLIEALEEVLEEEEFEDEEEEEEFEEEEEEFEDDLPDYEDMSLRELKAEARERGIRVMRGMKKEDLIEILEEDDEE